MVRSLKYCLKKSYIIICFLLFLGCNNKHEWYQKELTGLEKSTWSERLLNGAGRYYQGTIPEQFLLTEAATLDPQNSGVLREQGVAWLKRGFGVQMEKYYQLAVDVDPVAWQGYRGYNYLYFYRDYERAIADFNALDTLTSDTDYPQGQSIDYMRGLCYLGLNQYDEAINYFTKYIDEVTDTDGESWVDTYAFLYRGITYNKKGNVDLAQKDFEKGIKYYKNLADFSFHLAKIEFQKGNGRKATSLIKKAKEYFNNGYYHQRSYVTVQEELHIKIIEELEKQINSL